MLPNQRDKPNQRGTHGQQRPLDRLNSASAQAARAELLRCCASSRWATRLTAHRPYPDTTALLAAADEASFDLTNADLTEALAAETATAAAGRTSADERPPLEGPGSQAAHTALRAAEAAYESRFGHAFVICLDQLPPAERLDGILTALHRRLDTSADEEHAVTADELRRLAKGRLLRLVVREVTARSPSVSD